MSFQKTPRNDHWQSLEQVPEMEKTSLQGHPTQIAMWASSMRNPLTWGITLKKASMALKRLSNPWRMFQMLVPLNQQIWVVKMKMGNDKKNSPTFNHSATYMLANHGRNDQKLNSWDFAQFNKMANTRKDVEKITTKYGISSCDTTLIGVSYVKNGQLFNSLNRGNVKEICHIKKGKEKISGDCTQYGMPICDAHKPSLCHEDSVTTFKGIPKKADSQSKIGSFGLPLNCMSPQKKEEKNHGE